MAGCTLAARQRLVVTGLLLTMSTNVDWLSLTVQWVGVPAGSMAWTSLVTTSTLMKLMWMLAAVQAATAVTKQYRTRRSWPLAALSSTVPLFHRAATGCRQ